MRRSRWVVWLTAFALAVPALVALHGNSPAWAADEDPGSEAGFRTFINRERAARGLGALPEAADLLAVARRQSGRMASRAEVFHNPNLASEVDGWQLLGENVGTGSTVEQIHDALMASKVHRDVILQPRFTEVGVGVLRVGDALWVTQVFRQPESPSAPAPTTTAPAVITTEPPPDGGRAPPATTTTTISTSSTSSTTTTAVAQRPAEAAPVTGADAEPAPASLGRVAIASAGPALAAGPLPLPRPLPTTAAIPGLGVLAAALLLAVVGSASLSTRTRTGMTPR